MHPLNIISICPNIYLDVCIPFYLRTHPIPFPVNELLLRYHPNLKGVRKASHKQLVNAKTKLYDDLVAKFNQGSSISDYFNEWESVSLRNPSASRGNASNPSTHLSFPIVPSCIWDDKRRILRSELAKDLKESFEQELNLAYANLGIRFNIRSVQTWFFDWNAGGFDIEVEVHINRADDLELMNDAAYAVYDLLKNFLEAEKIAEKLAEKLAQELYDSFYTVLNHPIERPGFQTQDHAYGRLHNEFSRNVIVCWMPETGGIAVAESKVLQFFSDFTSDFPAKEPECLRSDKQAKAVVSGFNGNCALLRSTDRHTPIRLLWIWKLALFYIAGLSKQNERLTGVSLSLGLVGNGHQFFEDDFIKRFPDYSMRIKAYMQELKLDVRADHALDIHAYLNAWIAQKGHQLVEMVESQMDDISNDINLKHQFRHSELERLITAGGLAISVVAIGGIVIDLWRNPGRSIWDNVQGSGLHVVSVVILVVVPAVCSAFAMWYVRKIWYSWIQRRVWKKSRRWLFRLFLVAKSALRIPKTQNK